MKTYDFSPGASTLQSMFFAAWSICQLIVGSWAFQRGGFAYGIGVLFLGIVTFCAALFVVHRFNRQHVAVGDIGMTLEQGANKARVFAWKEISLIRRGQQSLELVLYEGAPLHIFYIEWDEGKKNEFFAALWSDLQLFAAEKNIAIAEE